MCIKTEDWVKLIKNFVWLQAETATEVERLKKRKVTHGGVAVMIPASGFIVGMLCRRKEEIISSLKPDPCVPNKSSLLITSL